MAKQEYLGESDVRGVASFAEPELTRPMPPNKGERGGLNAIRYEYPQCCMRRGFDGKQIICFDNAATSLVPKTVMAQSMLYAMLASANVHRGLSDISELSTNALEHSRSTAEDFINAPRGSVILAPNMTYGMNQVLYGVAEYMLEQGLLKKGDTITTSRAEHSSTILPFQQLSRWYGLKLNYMGVGRSGEVFVDIPEQSRIVSVVHASNVTGRVTDMRDVIEKITSNRNSNPNQFLIVDGAQALPHMPVDVQKIGCDAYVGAGHKIAGGAITPVYLDPRWHGVIPPVITGGGIPEDVGENKAELKTGPEGYEPGTPMVDAAVRLDAGIRFRVLAGLTWLETDEKRRDNLFSKSGGYEGFSGLRGQELVTALRRHLYGDPREPTEVMDEFTSALREGKQLKAGDWLRLDKGEPIPYEVSSYAMGNLHAHEMGLYELAIQQWNIRGYRLVGGRQPRQIGLVSIFPEKMSTDELAVKLKDYGFQLRHRCHCSHLQMRELCIKDPIRGPVYLEQQGTVRAAFDLFNTQQEVSYLGHALRQISAGRK